MSDTYYPFAWAIVRPNPAFFGKTGQDVSEISHDFKGIFSFPIHFHHQNIKHNYDLHPPTYYTSKQNEPLNSSVNSPKEAELTCS